MECLDIQARGNKKREAPGICLVCLMVNRALTTPHAHNPSASFGQKIPLTNAKPQVIRLMSQISRRHFPRKGYHKERLSLSVVTEREARRRPWPGPALASARPNARPGRGAHLSSGVMTSSCSVNRAMTFSMGMF